MSDLRVSNAKSQISTRMQCIPFSEHLLKEEPGEDLSSKSSKSGLRRMRTETRTYQLSFEPFSTQTSSLPHPKPSDLMEIVGSPFFSKEEHSFHIHNMNSKGETVGVASFQNKEHNVENIAWYWNPQSGFQIISSQSELIKTYGKDIRKVPFQFSKLVINESGIVAGSFLIDQTNDPRDNFNQYPWFWWSSENGIHLSPIPDKCQLVEGINNQGKIVISEINRSGIIVDITNKDDVREIKYPTREMMRQKIEAVFPIPSGELRKNALKELRFHFGSLNAHSIDDNNRVNGQGIVSITDLRNGKMYTAVLNFESVAEGLEGVYVKEIKESHSSKLIYHGSGTECEEMDPLQNPFDIPKWVLFIYKKYSSLEDAVTKCPDDALILIKYHLYRPDDKGYICKLALQSHQLVPLELIKLCLPSRAYLQEHPEKLDELCRLPKNGKHEISHYLSDVEIAKNCPERDAYFVDWFKYEMKKIGALENESYMDFLARKNLSHEEISNFISKCPLEIKIISLGSSNNKDNFWYALSIHKNFQHMILNPSVSKISKIEIYDIALRYNLCSPLFYGETQPNRGIWFDTFSRVLEDCWYWGYGDPRLMKLLKETFPSVEYRNSHPEKLSEYLDNIVWRICYTMGGNPHIALDLLKFLQNEGVDLQSIARSSKHPEIAKFLKQHGMMTKL